MKKMFLIVLALGLVTSMANFTSSAHAAEWRVPGDFATIQDAIGDANVTDGDLIMVGPGSFAGALVTKAVNIKGVDGATINDGPAHPSGLVQGFRLLAGSDGCTISHLRFIAPVALTIMNGAAVSDVTVAHNTLINQVQGISNWAGSRWEISHNEIVDLHTRNGGGIGILVGARFAGQVAIDSVISHNKIHGTLDATDPVEQGGYNGTGIVIYNDRRFGSTGDAITGNLVVKNNISLVSNNPTLVDVVAIELTDTDELLGVIRGNAIGFNDLRGTTIQIALTPATLGGTVNPISRNLGDNRGHGLHPSFIFGPN
ncbi:MAG: hypothetical protein F9K48_09140 [Candidatus Brocadia sp.]|nr:MAG: hypothetical protein F9K48_09140 [Candidatus Brocadia sp.]